MATLFTCCACGEIMDPQPSWRRVKRAKRLLCETCEGKENQDEEYREHLRRVAGDDNQPSANREEDPR